MTLRGDPLIELVEMSLTKQSHFSMVRHCEAKQQYTIEIASVEDSLAKTEYYNCITSPKAAAAASIMASLIVG